MAPSRPQSNGRSPLVNQQSQITSFFSKKNSTNTIPLPRPPPTCLAKQASKLNPNPKPNRIPSPTTPSPLQSRLKKPLLVIGQSNPPSPTNRTSGDEVVEKRLRVYRPSDRGNHLIRSDDAEEEELDLGTKKIEWVEETRGRFKRLRRGGSFVSKRVVIDDGDEDMAEEDVKERKK